MADPLNQAVQWGLATVRSFAVPIALAVGAYWAYLLFRRLFRSSSDPSIRKFSSSGIGSMSMVLSGAYLSALLAGSIALVTWPAPMDTPWLGALLVGGVAVHAAVEKREDMER
jgi:hypothetical protein